ncbi:atp-dependent rna helicase ddx19b [Stylonychia lemnae]|uniref:ATP-dependent RNA helicase n=1 Tax=Stylonychia lemnae TaxID=5949 RepID=A0A077ZXE8_STYLE|nr:atp-dependent rna helicase ddx19b [Stylonychia lemnae]|eukprot:CDW74580.1 atp-dependent rna helicase ddx19b [Stylonychia lemnae]
MEASKSNQGSALEEESKEPNQLIKGMRSLQFKKIVQDLHSKRSWKEIISNDEEKKIKDGLHTLSYTKPSIIQAAAIPKIRASPNENFLFQSGNGSGKTGAFCVPAIFAVDPSSTDYQVIILANSRELIRQIKQVLDVLSKNTGIKIEIGEDAEIKQCQILVTTPNYFANKLTGRTSIKLRAIKLVVFDEADEIFKHQSNLEILEVLVNYLKSNTPFPQYVLFLATLDDEVIENIKSIVTEFNSFKLKKEALVLKGVCQYYLVADIKKRREFLQKYFDMFKQCAMIFTNQKKTAIFIQDALKELGNSTEMLIGGGTMSFQERDRIIDGFRKQSFHALISTNVLARGIDVPEVDIVINFDIPVTSNEGYYEPDYANYQHRIGRTGRFGTDGLALTFVENDNDGVNMGHLKSIETHYGTEIKEVKSIEEFLEIYRAMRPYLFVYNDSKQGFDI